MNLLEEETMITQETQAVSDDGMSVFMEEMKEKILKSRLPRVGRNKPCICGATYSNGKPVKYKHCHGRQ
jgi:hypothetical protein